MKIALVRARYNPYGGAERFVARTIQALDEQGTEVTVFARRWNPDDAPASMRFVRCDPFYLGSLWRDWSFARSVLTRLAHERFDLVQSHERIPGLSLYRAGDGVHASWLERRKKTLGPLHQLVLTCSPYHRYVLHAERAMFEHPGLRAVICVSTLVRDEIAQRFRVDPAKLHIIPNGVDLHRFHPDACVQHRMTMRLQLGIPANRPVLIFVGSGFERKGLAAALHGVALASMQAHLVVVGSDKHAARYRRLARTLGIAETVHFVGGQSDPLPWYSAADALMLPTLYDPFANVALEALACGLPIIVSNACGAMDVVEPGVNGWIVAPTDHSGIAAAVEQCCRRLEDPEQAQALRHAARRSAEPYSLEALGSALLALYRNVLRDSGAGHR
jgi:UDP-glucose:(heptosyl)LPS alpha-1,3-glucosyltransferase